MLHRPFLTSRFLVFLDRLLLSFRFFSSLFLKFLLGCAILCQSDFTITLCPTTLAVALV
jgi:hypothetical protein